MADLAKLLHISDLHFNDDLVEGNRSLWAKLFSGLAAHDFEKLDELSWYIVNLRLQREPIDLLLATGDISTDGGSKSLETAREFVENADLYRYTPPQWVIKGLQSTKDRRIIIPGNHDRYKYLGGNVALPFQSESDALEEVFFENLPEYPYVVGYRRPGEENRAENAALLFFVFDSSASKKVPFRFNLAYRATRGYVSDQECKWLERKAVELRSERKVKGLDGTTLNIDYDRAIRVVALHHHPIRTQSQQVVERAEQIAQEEDSLKSKNNEERLKLLENAERFVQACFAAEIDVVLFGHQHVTFSQSLPLGAKPGEQTHFFCCPSTTQLSSKESGGFYVFHFGEDRLWVDYHGWSTTSKAYVIDAQKTSNPYPYRRRISLAKTAGDSPLKQ